MDLAKAKGSSETYAIKYMLSKFFLMPVKDEGDPDYKAGEEEEEEKKEEKPPLSSHNIDQSLTELQNQTNSVSVKQVEDLINLLRQKSKGDKAIQTKFFNEVDQQLVKRGIEGTTQVGNFRARLATLTPLDYQHLYN